MTTPASNVRLLPLAAILAEFKLHKTTIYGLIKRGKFPRPVKIGGSSRWLADELKTTKRNAGPVGSYADEVVRPSPRR